MINRKVLYGYQIQNGALEIAPEEQRAVSMVFTLYNAGASYQAISDALNRQDVPYCREVPLWNKHMNIVIKKMETDAEIKGKAYVHWKSWQEAYSGIVDQRYLDSLTLDKCEKIAFRRTDNVIIAKDGDSVIGFVGFGKYRNDELENAGEVFAIYILSQYYGKGIGYRLMQTALSELADHSKIAVWVLKENTKAIRFYERCGYRFDGREQIIELGSPVVAARMVLER